jgi:hypothetical protein
MRIGFLSFSGTAATHSIANQWWTIPCRGAAIARPRRMLRSVGIGAAQLCRKAGERSGLPLAATSVTGSTFGRAPDASTMPFAEAPSPIGALRGWPRE